MKLGIFMICGLQAAALAQEADAGFEMRVTASALGIFTHQLPSETTTGAFRAMLYPTWKLSKHWTITGAVQLHSQPYFYEEFANDGHHLKADVLQATLGYSRFWGNKSIVVRIGEMSSAFGSFLLRYDDAVNPLIDMPQAYGYYYKGVSNLGLAGAQVDVALGRFDARAQFTNSSPANRRELFDRDQYGTWTAGAGYTIRQGFRVGVSAYRGPYLDRGYAFFFPGEAAPRDLPATAIGADVEWGRGRWNVFAEIQRFSMAYQLIPTFTEHTGYVEVRRVLAPRWYVATRFGYLRASAYPGPERWESAVGFRPNSFQVIKVGYEAQFGPTIRGSLGNTLAIQLVTSFRPFSVARD